MDCHRLSSVELKAKGVHDADRVGHQADGSTNFVGKLGSFKELRATCQPSPLHIGEEISRILLIPQYGAHTAQVR